MAARAPGINHTLVYIQRQEDDKFYFFSFSLSKREKAFLKSPLMPFQVPSVKWGHNMSSLIIVIMTKGLGLKLGA